MAYTLGIPPTLALAVFQGGNQFGNSMSIGTADANSFSVMTNGVTAISIDTNQVVSFAGSVAPTGVIAAPNGAVGAPAFTFASDLDCGMYRIGANDIGLATNGALSLEIKGLDVVCGNAAIATSATSGFFWAPGCAGAATGTPANTFTGRVPLVFDTTNGRLYAYYGGAWKYAAVAT